MTEEVYEKSGLIKRRIVNIEKKLSDCTDFSLTITHDEPYFKTLNTMVIALRKKYLEDLKREFDKL